MFRWIILTFILLTCGAASWQLQGGHLDVAMRLGGLAAVLAVLMVLEADKLLVASLSAMQGVRRAWKEGQERNAKAKADSAVSRPARAGAKASTVERKTRAAAIAPGPVAWKPSLPALPEVFELPWMVILGVAIFFILGGQYYLLAAASVIKGAGLTVVGLFLAWRWWHRSSDSLQIPLLATLPQFLGCAVVALGLWFYGAVLIWRENELGTYIGTAMTWAGTALGAWAAMRFIERPLAQGQEEQPFMAYDVPDAEHSWGSIFRWPLLGLTLLFLTLMATATNYVVSLGLMLLAIASFLLGAPFIRQRWQERQGFGLGLLAVGAAALAMGFHAQSLIEHNLVNRGLWWFLAAGLGLSLIMASPEETSPQKPLFSEKAALVLLVVAAFCLRFINVALFPYGVEGDEAGYGIVFNNMNHVPQLMQNIFRFNNVGVALYWLGAFFMKLFGVSVLTLRLASVVYGTLSILTFYFMARLVLRWQAALLGAVALTVSTWHLHYSRFGHLNISQVFVQSACFYFFWKGMLSKRLRYFAVGGLCLGLAFMAHTAGKLVPFFFFGFLVYLALVHPKALARRTAGILIFFLVSWATVAPVMTYYLKFPLQGTGRIKEVSIMNNQNSNAPADAIAGAAANFRVSMLMFNQTGDFRSRDNPLAPQPMLDHWSGVLFLLGFGFALYHWKRPLYAFMLLAFFGTLSASVISVEAPQSLRTAGNIPIVYFFVAVFFDRALDLGRRAWAAMGEKLVLLGLAVLLGIMANSNLHRYFDNNNYGWDLLPTLIGMHAGELGQDYEVRFFSENFGGGHPPVTLFANGTPIRSHGELLEALPLRSLTPNKGVSLAFSDRYRLLSDYAYWLYPQAKAGKIKTKVGTEVYDTLTLTPAQVTELYGWEGTVKTAGGPARPDTLKGLDWPQGLSRGAGTLEGHWKGTFFAPDWEEMHFSFAGPGQASLRLDGREVARSQGPAGPWLKLPIGPHSAEFSFHGQGDLPVQLLWERRVTTSGGRYWALAYDSKIQPVPSDLILRSVPQVGFTQHFFAGTNFEGPYTAKIDAVPFARWIDGPIGGPFSSDWRGKLNIEKEGDYGFYFNGGTYSDIEVAGKLIERRGNPTFKVDSRPQVATIHLRPGTYPIRVRCAVSANIFMELTWSTPDTAGQHVMLPPRLLKPELNF
jgi:4-amino-4-deoxy-L-arabinose transferase-like glycosyltransferase